MRFREICKHCKRIIVEGSNPAYASTTIRDSKIICEDCMNILRGHVWKKGEKFK